MFCKEWQGYAPEIMVGHRLQDLLDSYEGSVIAVCEDCPYACVWSKNSWAARIARDFVRRKVAIGQLRDSIRMISERTSIFIKLKNQGVRSDLKRSDCDDIASACGDKYIENGGMASDKQIE